MKNLLKNQKNILMEIVKKVFAVILFLMISGGSFIASQTNAITLTEVLENAKSFSDSKIMALEEEIIKGEGESLNELLQKTGGKEFVPTSTSQICSLQGQGTTTDPYVIMTPEDLSSIRNELTAYYVLGADIDLLGINWQPIGNESTPFSGGIDGSTYRINNLTIDRESMDVGLFGCSTGIINNIRLRNVNVESNSVVGALVGINKGNVNRCTVNGGAVSAKASVGGLVGRNEGNINNSFTNLETVVGTPDGEYTNLIDDGNVAGSLVGLNNGNIESCYAQGSVVGKGSIGGLVGAQNKGRIYRSYSKSDVGSKVEYAGGLVGNLKKGTVEECYAVSDIRGDFCVGGLIGKSSGVVKNSYSNSNIVGNSAVGGLIGKNTNVVSCTYAAGTVNGKSSVGGLIGASDGAQSVQYSYWCSETTGQALSEGGTALTISEMAQESSFVGFNFSGVWELQSNSTVPFLTNVAMPDEMELDYVVNNKSFDLIVNLSDVEEEDLKLENATFVLLHPDDDYYEGITKENTTNYMGKTTINAKALYSTTGEYTLEQTVAENGYDVAGFATVSVTFNDIGEILRAEVEGNDLFEIESFNATQVFVKVANRKKADVVSNSINLEVAAKDQDDGSGIQGIRFLMSSKSEDGIKSKGGNKTDENGVASFNNKISGYGEIKIKINAETKPGYKVDTSDKTVVLQRDIQTGALTLVRWKCSDDINVSIVNNTIKVEYEVEPKNSTNTIGVKVVDKTDTDVKIKNLTVKLEEIETGTTRYLQPSDDGVAYFALLPHGKGSYNYRISVENMPSDYEDVLPAAIQVTFDAKGRITGAREISINSIIASLGYNDVTVDMEADETENSINNIVLTGLLASRSNAVNLYRVYYSKVDENQLSSYIPGYEHRFTLESSNVVLVVDKTTDQDGSIQFDVPIKRQMKIRMQETKANSAYILNSEEKEVNLSCYYGTTYSLGEYSENLREPVVNSSDKTITIIDTAQKKINALSKARVNFEFTTKDQDGNILKNVLLEVLDERNGVPYEVRTDNEGKITLEGLSIQEEGTYVYDITRKEAISGFNAKSLNIKLELGFEINNDKMENVYHMVKLGADSLEAQDYTQEETQETYLTKVKFIVINEVTPIQNGDGEEASEEMTETDAINYKIDIVNVDKLGKDPIYEGKYEMYIQYEDTHQQRLGEFTATEGIEIEAFKLTEMETIILREKEAPVGYDLSSEMHSLKLNIDAQGKAYHLDHSANVEYEIKEETHVDGTVDNIILIKILKEREIIPCAIEIVTDCEEIEGSHIEGIEYEIELDGHKLENQTTDPDGKILIDNIRTVGTFIIKLKEVRTPRGFSLEKEPYIIAIHRNPSSFEMDPATDESNVLAEQYDFDNDAQIGTITLKKDQEITFNFVKADKGDPTKRLEGAKFEVTSNKDYQAPKYCETDSNGTASVVFNKVKNEEVEYTIKETKGPEGYDVGEGKEFKVKVAYDITGRIESYEMLDSNGAVTGSSDKTEEKSWARIYDPLRSVPDLEKGGYTQVQRYIGANNISFFVLNSNNYNFKIKKIDSRSNEGDADYLVSGADFNINIEHNGKIDVYNDKSTINGEILLEELSGSGEIIINYEETYAGVGYANTNESGRIVFTKGQGNKLTLDNSQTTVDLSRVSVNQDESLIEVVVQAQSKFDIGVKTVDIDSNDPIMGARYKIVSSENEEDNDISRQDGTTTINMGRSYREKTVTYTLMQLEVGTGTDRLYNKIDDIVFEVHFDKNGAVSSFKPVQGADRIVNTEFAEKNSQISPNFDGNELNLEITNGVSDRYKIVIQSEQKDNHNFMIEGIKHSVRGFNSNGNEVFNNNTEVSGSDGRIEITDVTIHTGFYLEIEELETIYGYNSDTTKYMVSFEEALTDSGAIVIQEKENPQALVVSIDPIEKVVLIRIGKETNGTNLVISKKEAGSENTLIAGAGIEILDNDTGDTYKIITTEQGNGSVSIPLKSDGIHTFDIVETDAPTGYRLAPEAQMTVDYLNNEVVDVRITKGDDAVKLKDFDGSNINLILEEQVIDTEADAYGIELIRLDSKTGNGIAHSQNTIKVINVLSGQLTHPGETNEQGHEYFENSVRDNGSTEIIIGETTAGPGYTYDARTISVIIYRDMETGEIEVKSATGGISTSDIAINTNSKMITITMKNDPLELSTGTKTINVIPFELNIVNIVQQTSTPVHGFFTIKITPVEGSDNSRWAKNIYSWENEETRTYVRIGTAPYFDQWAGRWITPLTETGTVTKKGIYADGDIKIEIDQIDDGNGYEVLTETQEIILNRNGVTGEITLVQEGQQVHTVWDVNLEKNIYSINIEVPARPYLQVELEKMNLDDEREKLDGVEFEISKLVDDTHQLERVTTDNGGNATAIIKNVQPNSTMDFLIREVKTLNGYKLAEEAVLTASFDEAGKIKTHKITRGEDNTEIYIPVEPCYDMIGNQNMKAHTDKYVKKHYIKLHAKNRDACTLEIVNEDRAHRGSVIEGSKFQITVTDEDGNTQIFDGNNEGKTDNLGKWICSVIRQKGNLNIHYKQLEAGPGYRTDDAIEGDIEVFCDGESYGMELKNITGPAELVENSIEDGRIAFKVYNDAKLDLEVINISTNESDNSEIKLAESKFTVTSQIIQRGGLDVEDPVIDYGELTTDINGSVTQEVQLPDGGTVVEYIITQTEVVEGYNTIGNIRFIAIFDGNGKLVDAKNPSSPRGKVSVVDRGKIQLIVDNSVFMPDDEQDGNIIPYNFQIQLRNLLKIDSSINGVKYNVETYVNDKKVDSKEITMNDMVIGKYTEKAIGEIKDLEHTGTIKFVITETEVPDGFTPNYTTEQAVFSVYYGRADDYNITHDLAPIIEFMPELSTVDAAQVNILNGCTTLRVTLSKAPSVTMGIRNVVNDGSETIIPIKTYRITSKEEGSVPVDLTKYNPKYSAGDIEADINTLMTDTNLNVEKQMTAEHEERYELGDAVASKTIVYIVEEPNARGDYDAVAKIAVKFDENGKVIESALLTDDNRLSLEQAQTMDEYTDFILNINVDDIVCDDLFNLTISKISDRNNSIKLDGVSFKVEVFAEDGSLIKFANDSTGDDGTLELTELPVYGKTTVKVTEIQSKEGYYNDGIAREFTVQQREKDKVIKLIDYSSNISAEDIKMDEPTSTVSLRMKNSPLGLTFCLNNSDIDNRDVKLSGAEFVIIDTEEYDGHNVEIEDTLLNNKIQKFEVNDIGSVSFPKKTEGTHQFKLKQTRAANGAVLNSDEVIFNVTYAANETIDTITVDSAYEDVLKIVSSMQDYIEMDFLNRISGLYNLQIIKEDLKDTSKKLEKVEIKIDTYNGAGIKIDDLKSETDAQGIIEFKNLRLDGVTRIELKETRACDGYKLSDETYEFSLKRRFDGLLKLVGNSENLDNQIEVNEVDRDVVVHILNVTNAINLNVVKQDFKDTGNPIDGVLFEIKLLDEDDNEIKTLNEVTTSDGTFCISNLEINGHTKIQLKEVSGANGYVVNEGTFEIVVGIDENGEAYLWDHTDNLRNLVDVNKQTNDVTVKVPTPTNIMNFKIVSEDASNPEIKLDQMRYEIKLLDTSDNEIDTFEKLTDSEGIISLDRIRLNDVTKIQIRQTRTSADYIMNDDVYELTALIRQDGVLRVINNSPNLNNKVDTEDSKNEVLVHIQSRSNKVVFCLNNYEKDTKTALSGAEFELIDEDLYTGTEYSVNDTMLTTGRERFSVGTVGSVLLPVKDKGDHLYTLKQISSAKDYKREQTVARIIISFSEENTVEMVEIQQGEKFVTREKYDLAYIELNYFNKIVDKFSVRIVKENVNDATNYIQGAKFKVTAFDENGNQIYSNDEEQVKETDASGKLEISDIVVNGRTTVKVKEIDAPDGYVIDKEVREFEIIQAPDGTLRRGDISENLEGLIQLDTNNNIAEIRMKNRPRGIQLAVKNTDRENREMFLSGAEYEIIDLQTYEDTPYDVDDELTMTGIERFTVNQTGTVTLPEKIKGEYTYKITEVKPAFGYFKDDTTILLKVAYDDWKLVSSAFVIDGNEIAKVKDGTNSNYIELEIMSERDEISIGSYNIEVISVNEKDKDIFIPGTQFDIKVQNEIGVQEVGGIKETNRENGSFKLSNINGAGKIQIRLNQLVVPESYKLNKQQTYVELYRDEATGQFKWNETAGVDIKVNSKDKTVIIYVSNKQESGLFTMVINKCSDDVTNIPSDKTKVQLDMGNDPIIVNTDENGRIILNDVEFPEDDGTYIYTITELESPLGYKKLEEEQKIKVTYGTDSDGKRSIMNVEIVSGDATSLVRKNVDYIELNILNEASDIRLEKVDSEDSSLKIVGAQFELVNENTTDRFDIRTDNDGIAEIPGTPGTYRLVELNATSGYTLYSTAIRYTIAFDNNGQRTCTLLSEGAPLEFRNEGEQAIITISNVQQSVNNVDAYSLEIYKVDNYDDEIGLPGAKFKVNVQNEVGVENVSKIDYTNENGLLAINEINGTGRIDIQISEYTAPDNRKLNTLLKNIVLQRDSSGNISVTESAGLRVNTENNKIKVYYPNQYEAGYYTLAIQTVDKDGDRIEEQGIQYSIKKEGSDSATTIETNDLGKAFILNENMPITEGYNTYTITQVTTPTGYSQNSEQIQVGLEFKTVNGILVLNKADVLSGSTVSVANRRSTYCLLNISNELIENRKFVVEKVDAENENYKIPMISFEIKNEATGDIETKTTDRNGRFSVVLPENEDSVVYTITESNEDKGYEIISPIRVQADFNGETVDLDIIAGASSAEVRTPDEMSITLGGPFDDQTANAVEEFEPTKLIVKNRQKQVEGDNTKPYAIQFVAVDSMNRNTTLSNVQFRITVQNEIGIQEQVITQVTDANGIIPMNNINGYGRIKIEMEQLSQPAGYKMDDSIKTLLLYRNKLTNIFTYTDGAGITMKDVVLDNQDVIQVYITNRLLDNKYNFVVKTVDEDGNEIKDDNAIFEIKNISVNEASVNNGFGPDCYKADSNGETKLEGKNMPTKEGYITYQITQKTAPNGYILNNDTHTVKLRFRTIEGVMSIVNATVEGNDNIISIDDTATTEQQAVIKFVNTQEDAKKFVVEKVSKEDETIKLSNIKFNVLNGITQQTEEHTTDSNGHYDIVIPDDGTRTMFTLSEIDDEAIYQPIGDIKVVSYFDGDDVVIEMLQGEDCAYVVPANNGEPTKLVIKNSLKQTTDAGTEPTLYKVNVVKVDSSDTETVLENALLDVKVSNEFGVASLTKSVPTDENGNLVIDNINGYGNISIEITELNAPNNYVLDNKTKVIELFRDETTSQITQNGNLENISAEDVVIDNINQIIYVYVRNELQPNLFDLVVRKVDSNGDAIYSDFATFEISELSVSGQAVNSNEYVTKANGKAYVKDIAMPTVDKNIKYSVQEKQAPNGYELNNDIHEVELQFRKENGKVIVKNAIINNDTVMSVDTEKTTENHVELVFVNNEIADEPVVEVYEDNEFIVEAVDSENVDLKLKDINYDIVNENTNETIQKTTDSAGKFTLVVSNDGNVVTYKVTEQNVNNGYITNNEFRFTAQYVNGKVELQVLNNVNYAEAINANDETETSKLVIKNTKEPTLNTTFAVNVIKVDEIYKQVALPGSALWFNIDCENGDTGLYISGTTKEDGKLTNGKVDGNGDITITIGETIAPVGYRRFTETKVVRLIRDAVTNQITIGQDLAYITAEDIVIDNDNQVVDIYVTNKTVKKYFYFVINKLNNNGNEIVDENMEFEVNKINDDSTTSAEQNRVVIDGKPAFSIEMPSQEGTVSYTVNEKVAPDGYELDNNTYTANVTFQKINNKMSVTNVTIDQNDKVSVNKTLSDNTAIYLDFINNKEGQGQEEQQQEEQFDNNEFIIEKVNSENTDEKIPGIKFNILNENTNTTELKETDSVGKFTLTVPTDGQTITYKVSEVIEDNGFNPIDDFRFTAQYVNGKVVLQVIGTVDYAEAINVNTTNADANGKVTEVSKLMIKNTRKTSQTNEDPFAINVIKVDELDRTIHIPGAKLTITAVSGYGSTPQVVTSTTKDDGTILFNNVSGYGAITITIRETRAPTGYKFFSNTKTVTLNREQNNTISIDESGLQNITVNDIEIDNDNQIINIYVENTPIKKWFYLVVNKVDESGVEIADNNVEFEVREITDNSNITARIVADNSQNESDKKQVEVMVDGKPGLSIEMPRQECTKRYSVQEKVAPAGYKLDPNAHIFEVEFRKVNGAIAVANVVIDGNEQVISLSEPVANGKNIYLNFKDEADSGNNGGGEEDDNEITLTSESYLIDDLYIDRIYPNTTIYDFVRKLNTDANVTITDAKGNIVNNDDKTKYIGTSYTVTLTKGNNSLTRKAVVVGDINYDGKVELPDANMITRSVIRLVTLNDIQARAADITGNGEVNVADSSVVERFVIRLEQKLFKMINE